MRDSSVFPRQTSRANRPRHGRTWVWFFVVLAVLTVVAVGIEVWYSFHNQLTAEQLSAAERLWKEKGPRDYEMDYTLKKVDGTEEYAVQVRNNRVVAVTRNGQPVEERLFHYSDMRALFGFIDEFLKQDAQPQSPRTFATATFDSEDGHLIHYIRSVMSKRERVEINVRLRRVDKGAS
jgi:hypothetical protein